MITTNKIFAGVLVAALAAAALGAVILHSRHSATVTQPAIASVPAPETANNPNASITNASVPPAPQFGTEAEQSAYKVGFADGYQAALNGKSAPQGASRSTSTTVESSGGSRDTRYAHPAYTTQKRTFWQKHRDKLTVAMGAGGGALVGGLIGGKKGAGIGALAGGGGSALYTYKLRKRHR